MTANLNILFSLQKWEVFMQKKLCVDKILKSDFLILEKSLKKEMNLQHQLIYFLKKLLISTLQEMSKVKKYLAGK